MPIIKFDENSPPIYRGPIPTCCHKEMFPVSWFVVFDGPYRNWQCDKCGRAIFLSCRYHKTLETVNNKLLQEDVVPFMTFLAQFRPRVHDVLFSDTEYRIFIYDHDNSMEYEFNGNYLMVCIMNERKRVKWVWENQWIEPDEEVEGLFDRR